LTNNVLYNYQYSFRANHSVTHALLDVTSLIFDAIQNKQHTAMLFMDLRKAFDAVSHEIQKLYYYGLRGMANDLIKNYTSLQDNIM